MARQTEKSKADLIKTGCAELYKISRNFATESAESATVEGKFLTLKYSGDSGVLLMIVEKTDETDWIQCIPNLNVSVGDLPLLKTPKAIQSVSFHPGSVEISINRDSEFRKKLKDEHIPDKIVLSTFDVNPEYDPIKDIVDSMEWIDVKLNRDYEDLQVNIKTGQAYLPGTRQLPSQSDILILNKRIIPKQLSEGETLFAVQAEDENVGYPFGLFMTDKYIALVKYTKILTEI